MTLNTITKFGYCYFGKIIMPAQYFSRLFAYHFGLALCRLVRLSDTPGLSDIKLAQNDRQTIGKNIEQAL